MVIKARNIQLQRLATTGKTSNAEMGNKEIEKLETKEDKINEAKQSGRQIANLINYFSQSWDRVKIELEKRK